RVGQQDAQRLVDAHHVADALDSVRGKPGGALALPLEKSRARRRAKQRALLLGAQAPALGDVEERRERGGAELFGIEIGQAGGAGLQHRGKSCNGVIMKILQYWTKRHALLHGSPTGRLAPTRP